MLYFNSTNGLCVIIRRRAVFPVPVRAGGPRVSRDAAVRHPNPWPEVLPAPVADGGKPLPGGADRQAVRGENYGNQGNGAPGPVRKCRSAACATSGARPAAARRPMCAAMPQAAMFPARSGGTRQGRRRRWPRAPARRSGRG